MQAMRAKPNAWRLAPVLLALALAGRRGEVEVGKGPFAEAGKEIHGEFAAPSDPAASRVGLSHLSSPVYDWLLGAWDRPQPWQVRDMIAHGDMELATALFDPESLSETHVAEAIVDQLTGQFHFPGVEPGVYLIRPLAGHTPMAGQSLLVWGSHVPPLSLLLRHTGTARIELGAWPPRRFSGRLQYPNGAPFRGWIVPCSPGGPLAEGSARRTDADGRFAFPIPARSEMKGQLGFAAITPGQRVEYWQVDETEAGATWVVGHVHGWHRVRVVDARTGRPIEGARLVGTSKALGESGPRVERAQLTTTDACGRACFGWHEGLGTTHVRLVHAEGMMASQGVHIGLGRVEELRLVRGVRVVGRVKPPAGVEMGESAWASCYVGGASSPVEQFVRTPVGSNGSFDFGVVAAPGSTCFVAVSSQQGSGRGIVVASPQMRAHAHRDVVSILLPLRQHGRIEGRVSHTDGSPAVGVPIFTGSDGRDVIDTLSHLPDKPWILASAVNGPRAFQIVVTDEAGTFRVENLAAPASYSVSVLGGLSSSFTSADSVQVAPGECTQVQLEPSSLPMSPAADSTPAPAGAAQR